MFIPKLITIAEYSTKTVKFAINPVAQTAWFAKGN